VRKIPVAAGFLAVFGLALGSGLDAGPEALGAGARAPGPAGESPDFAAHAENTWIKASPREGAPIPSFGWEGSGAYDPFHQRWIHQGGHDGNPQGFALFTFDLATARWEQRFPNTSPPGSCCVDGANVFDRASRRFVRFPGAALGHGWQWSRGVKLKSSPVWLYDPESGSWTNMRPPPYREAEKYAKTLLGSLNAGATYDPVHEVALSFGGQGSGGGMNNLFVYDAYSNRLERLPGENPPEPRDGHGIAYDEKNDCLVVFGSQYGNDERTWLYRYSKNAWEGLDLSPHPPARKGKTYSTIPKMAYDSQNGVLLCLAWDDATGQHETWALDASVPRWTRMNPEPEPLPSMSRSRNLSYLPEHNVFLLELAGKDRGPELWTYRFRKASPNGVRPPDDLRLESEPGKASLVWSPVPGAQEYRVYRAPAEKPWEARYTRLASPREAHFEDPGLASGKTYFYRVAAVGPGGVESPQSVSVRTEPRVLLKPLVSVLAPDKVEIAWNPHPVKDLVGYNLYRGTVSVATVKKGSPGAWKDNDPEYKTPQVVAVRDISNWAKLNDGPISGTAFTDSRMDLGRPGPESGDYRYAVYAYVVRAVNRRGTESGPSPYALTLAAEPEHVLVREKGGQAEVKWEPSREKGIVGYLVYELAEQRVGCLTPEPVTECAFRPPAGGATKRYVIVPVDVLGQEGQPSSPAWANHSYKGFFPGEWHQ
jgi:hypothetical protein